MTVDTLCVQGGWQPKKGEPRQVPVYASTTFRYETSEQMADLFDLKASGYFYTRLANPTNDAVAKKIAALEGGVAAILTSSGQAASTFAISLGEALGSTNVKSMPSFFSETAKRLNVPP